jgi:hypothetical protein
MGVFNMQGSLAYTVFRCHDGKKPGKMYSPLGISRMVGKKCHMVGNN